MRNRELLKEVIAQTLEAITEQESVIQRYDGKIPQIEIDLIMENIRRLYENFHFLDKMNGEKFRIQNSELRSNEEVGSDEEVDSRQFTVGSEVESGLESEVETEVEGTIGNEQLAVGNGQLAVGNEGGSEAEVEVEVGDGDTETIVDDRLVVDRDEVTSVDNDYDISDVDLHRGKTFVENDETTTTDSEPQGGETFVENDKTTTTDSEPQGGEILNTEIDKFDNDEIFIPKTSISFGLPTKQDSDPTTNEIEQPNLETKESGTDQQTIKTVISETDLKQNNGLLDLFDDNPPTIADQYKTNEATLHDTITSGEDDSLASKMQKIPINDLKSHIGINDRFRFINELFLASMKDYDEAIEQLNNFSNKPEAIAYFNKIVERYKMDQSMDSFKRLRDFVLRKYLQ